MSSLFTQKHPPNQVEYKPVPGFLGYRIGNDSSVWSCWKRTSTGRAGLGPRKLGTEWKQLKRFSDKRGRFSVNLCRDRRVFRRMVHQLVLLAFVGPCPPGMEACHFPDKDTGNNNLSNLRWDTKKSNAKDKVTHGTDPKGVRNGMARLTENQVLEVRELSKNGFTRVSLAKRFGVRSTTIDAVVNGVTWKHLL